MFTTRLLPALLSLLAAAVPATRAEVPVAVEGAAWRPAGGLLLNGTVVTMDADDTILRDGHVLVRDGIVVAAWSGPHPPAGVDPSGASSIDLGPQALVFPGLINLHDHLLNDMLPAWMPPSSHAQPSAGRPAGTEPYANRYQWNTTTPAEYRRLVTNPVGTLTSPDGLNLAAETVKYAEIRALLGGTTATQGGTPNPATDSILARNVDASNFGRDRVDARVGSIASLNGTPLATLRSQMAAGQIDAWLVHLAEGVRDASRRPGDTVSSRAEFDVLRAKGLLGDATVIIHGTGLEASDFVAMAAAPSLRATGAGDRRGAKLVWSPLSNLLLYGETTRVYEALEAGVLVSLGTDWTPSGSPNLLAELKVADIALRSQRLLGAERGLIPALSTTGKNGDALNDAEVELDKLLVSMVTRNPAATLRWAEAGSIEPGKAADLLVITDPLVTPRRGLPNSPYRSLIDATERDVRLVLVGGEPLAGDVEILDALKPGDYETVSSADGCLVKAVDATRAGVPLGMETLAQITTALSDGLRSLGGDNPPAGGGLPDASNTYSYLKARLGGGRWATWTDARFRPIMTLLYGTVDGHINAEAIQLDPLLTSDHDWLLHALAADVDEATGLLMDGTPPYGRYPANLNHLQDVDGHDPLAYEAFEDRWLDTPGVPCASEGRRRRP